MDLIGSIGAAVSRQIAALSASPTGSLSLGLIVSLAFSLWAVSNGTYNLLRAIRLSYGLGPQAYVNARFRGVIAGLASVIAIGLIALVSSAIGGIDDGFPGWAKALVTVFVYLPLNAVHTPLEALKKYEDRFEGKIAAAKWLA